MQATWTDSEFASAMILFKMAKDAHETSTASHATDVVAIDLPVSVPVPVPVLAPEQARCLTPVFFFTCREENSTPLCIFNAASSSSPATATRKPHASKQIPSWMRPPCGTWGCTLPDRHAGLHDTAYITPSENRPRVVRPPSSPSSESRRRALRPLPVPSAPPTLPIPPAPPTSTSTTSTTTDPERAECLAPTQSVDCNRTCTTPPVASEAPESPPERKPCAAKRRRCHRVLTRPPCGTWGCTLPDLHSGLHNNVDASLPGKRQRVSRPPPSPPPPPLPTPPPTLRIGENYQATNLPEEGVVASVDRGDEYVSMTPQAVEELRRLACTSADYWRRRMHAAYVRGDRDAGYLEELSLYADHPCRPETGLREGVDPHDEGRVGREYAALARWRDRVVAASSSTSVY